MIFAITDYSRYHHRRDRYSNRAMVSNGWCLAKRSEFKSTPCPLVGDVIILSTTGSAISWAVMYFTNSEASHVAVFGENWEIYDCTLGGVMKTHFDDYLDNFSYLMIGAAPETVRRRPEITLKYLKDSIGQPYGWSLLSYMFMQRLFCAVPTEFNWKIPVDILLIFFVLGLFFKSFFYVGIIYLIIVLANWLRGRRAICV